MFESHQTNIDSLVWIETGRINAWPLETGAETNVSLNIQHSPLNLVLDSDLSDVCNGNPSQNVQQHHPPRCLRFPSVGLQALGAHLSHPWNESFTQHVCFFRYISYGSGVKPVDVVFYDTFHQNCINYKFSLHGCWPEIFTLQGSTQQWAHSRKQIRQCKHTEAVLLFQCQCESVFPVP